jgi:hypothetical protein
MKRTSLAVEGSPPTGGMRVELARLPDDTALQLIPIQDNDANGLACVYRASVRLGGASFPAAVKVQRPVALTGEERTLASAKLDGEYILQGQFQRQANADVVRTGSNPGAPSYWTQRLPLVQVIPFGDAAGPEAEVLSPSILCTMARHALAPRCPRDGQELEAEELVNADEAARLVCPQCGTHYPLTGLAPQQVLQASVRRDPACVGCPHQTDAGPEACMRQATFLNPLPSRILLYQTWDLDLQDYWRWRRGLPAGPAREWVWNRLDDYRRSMRSAAMFPSNPPSDEKEGATASSVPEDPSLALKNVVTLFTKIVDVVEQMHQGQVAVLNLNPHALALSVHASDLDLAVADLSHAHHRDAPLSWRQLQLLRPLTNSFSAPECQEPSGLLRVRLVRWAGNQCELTMAQDADKTPSETPTLCGSDIAEPWFCVGDWFAVQHEGLQRDRFVVQKVWEADGCWRVLGVRAEHGASGSSRQENSSGGTGLQTRSDGSGEPSHSNFPAGGRSAAQVAENDWTEAADVEVFRQRHCGASADVFSLGMLLLFLLSPREDAPALWRKGLAAIQRAGVLLGKEMQLELCSPSALVRALLSQPSAEMEAFRRCEESLAVYETSRAGAQELLGMVLLATVRGDPERFYLPNRGSSATRALRMLRADLECVRTGLRDASPNHLLPGETFVFGMFQQMFVEAFRRCWTMPGGPPEERERWKQQHGALWMRLVHFEDLLCRLEQHLAACGNGTDPQDGAVRIRGCEGVVGVVQELEKIEQEIVAQHPDVFQRVAVLGDRWTAHFMADPSRTGPNGLVEEYRQQWENKCQRWRMKIRVAIESLNRHAEEIKTGGTGPGEDATQKKTWLKTLIPWPWRSQPSPQELTEKGSPLSISANEVRELVQPAAALELLRECHLGPGVEVEAALAVLNFEDIRSRTNGQGTAMRRSQPHPPIPYQGPHKVEKTEGQPEKVSAAASSEPVALEAIQDQFELRLEDL